MTRDPAGYGGGINLYSYAKNNPVNRSDPSGLSSEDGNDDLDRLGGGGSEGSIIGAGLIQFPQQQQFQAGSEARGSLADFARQTPGVGLVVMAAGAITGCDYIAGKRESAGGRKWDAFGAITSALPYASRLRSLARIAPELKCAAGWGRCFAADTPVLMDDGSHKPIQDVQAHDLVQTEDPDTGKTEVKEVLSTSVRTAHDLVTVTTADAVTHKTVDTLTCTPEHPFRTQDAGWVLAGNLAVGTSILTRAGPAVVVASVAKTHSDTGVSVYNFIVQDDHTYFVGNQNEWVHNGTVGCGFSLYDMYLNAASYLRSRPAHFKEANESLLAAMQASSKLADTLERRFPGLQNWLENGGKSAPRQSPPGLTWHHHEDPGRMQLVPNWYHWAQWGDYHPGNQGGFSIWGRGN